MKCHLLIPFVAITALTFAAKRDAAFYRHAFQRQQLTDDYYSEGIHAADINNDGTVDVLYGPFWFEGPTFQEKHLIYKTLPQPREGYANHFFCWPYDFDKDGWTDVFTVGFPGTPAHVYKNPGKTSVEEWEKHEVFDWVSNESPHFTQLVGDDQPELVCTRDGFFGYATVNWQNPLGEAWTFHKVSDQVAPERFGHGLGVGDINNDGRLDILMKVGWYEQPTDLEGDPLWTFHKAPFAPSGGAEMYAYDVDGDGDNDVITSLAAHDYGLAWFEQTASGFKEHLIMGDRPGHNKYGVYFSELHSVNLVDIDGDGLKDIVTGKTYWSHHRQAPGWDDGPVVYWFKLVRGEDGVDWVPHQADNEAGIGRQIMVKDLNGDSIPDIFSGGMKGAHVLIHQKEAIDEETWRKEQPKPIEGLEALPEAGEPAPIDPKTGAVPNAIEGETLVTAVNATRGTVSAQDMGSFAGGQWSEKSQLFWRGAEPKDSLSLELSIPTAGDYDLESVFTKAPDYGIIQLKRDGKPLGEPIDLYHFSKVTTTGVLRHALGKCEAGTLALEIEMLGANPHAAQAMFMGIDYFRLSPGS